MSFSCGGCCSFRWQSLFFRGGRLEVSIVDIPRKWVLAFYPPYPGPIPGPYRGPFLDTTPPSHPVTAGHRGNEPPLGEGDCISVQTSIPIY